MQPKTLVCQDGESIQANCFIPTEPPRAAIIIAAAMGVEQRYYQHIAKWLQQHGYWVLTFDYRGVGQSKLRPLHEYNNTILEWATQDASAALNYALSQQLEVIWLGHSLGGQLLPLVNQSNKIHQVLHVACGTGYWRLNATPLRRKAGLLWFVIVPLLLLTHRYFPGKKWGIVGDLPKSIMSQWRRWCLHPHYCVGVEASWVKQAFEQFTLPVTSLAMQDDEMLSMKNIHSLLALLGSQNKKLIAVSPSDWGLKRIGHLGFFRQEHQHKLWPECLLPLLAIQPNM